MFGLLDDHGVSRLQIVFGVGLIEIHTLVKVDRFKNVKNFWSTLCM